MADCVVVRMDMLLACSRIGMLKVIAVMIPLRTVMGFFSNLPSRTAFVSSSSLEIRGAADNGSILRWEDLKRMLRGDRAKLNQPEIPCLLADQQSVFLTMSDSTVKPQ